MKQPKTTLLTKKEGQDQSGWILLDAEGKTLGRFSSEVAKILRGKHKAHFTPHVDCGDGVIIVNADKIAVTGSKEAQKEYTYYTGHIGGHRAVPYRRMKERKPDFIIRHAVSGMMPKTKQGKAQLKRLRIFAGTDHNMDAQKPLKAEI